MNMLFFLFISLSKGGTAKGSTTIDKEDSQLAFTSPPDKFSLALKPEITCLPITIRLELKMCIFILKVGQDHSKDKREQLCWFHKPIEQAYVSAQIILKLLIIY